MMTRSIASLVLLTSIVAAQRPPSWVPLQLAAPLNPTAINQLGKTCTYVEGSKVHFYSGFARQWKNAVTATATPNVRVFNDLAFVTDPGQIIAFSSYRGTIETLSVSNNAIVFNPATQRNDSILIVQDGTTLWTFSAFVGSWSQRQLTTATPLLATQRHVALLAEGTNLYGMSAFDGLWVPAQSITPAVAANVDGSWGIIETSTGLHGFSAPHKSWSTSLLFSAGAQSLVREDCAVYWDATTAVGYSPLRGGFASTPLAGTPIAQADALVAALQVGNTVHFYSSVLSQWTQVQTGSAATVNVRAHIAVINEAGVLTAYSPFLGTLARLGVTTTHDGGNAGVAVGVNTTNGQVHLYSTITGQWVQAPAGTPATLPQTVWCGALIQTPTGYSAWSGRTGRFFPAPLNGPPVTWTDLNSSVMAVEDTNQLHIFEPRRELWISINKVNAGPLNVRIWRTMLLAVDGSTVHGYGAFAGTIESFTLPAPPSEITANSESVRAGVGTTLALFGGTPDLVTLYQFPEFRRVFPIGSVLEVQLHGDAGGLGVGFLGLLGTPIQVPPLGEFYLNPNLLVPFALGRLPADGRALTSFSVPNDTSLRGIEVFLQGVVVPPVGTLYLTRLTSVGLY